MKHSTIFIIQGGKPVVLLPFASNTELFSKDTDVQLEGRVGLTAEPDIVSQLRTSVYAQAERALKKNLTGRGYYWRLFGATLTFVGLYLFLSIVVRDPLPVVDELLIASLGAWSVFLFDERRILSSSTALSSFGNLRVRIDSAFFRESRVVSIVETWREELILLGPAAFYRSTSPSAEYSLMEDDIMEAEQLCALFSERWKNDGLLREIYDAVLAGRQPGKLLDRLTRKKGLDEAALALSYLKLLVALEQKKISL